MDVYSIVIFFDIQENIIYSYKKCDKI